MTITNTSMVRIKSEAEAKYKRYKGNQIKGVTNKTFYFGEMADTFIKNVF